MKDIQKDKESLDGLAAAAAGPKRDKKVRSRLGQVVVEMMLILPVFLTLVFTIMEMGYIAFFVLLLNHATYECARIGAMRATPLSGGEPGNVEPVLRGVMERALPGARVVGVAVPTLLDPQSNDMNHDLVVTGTYDVRLVFPISSRLFAKPAGTGTRQVEAIVRMPIERPQKR